MIIRSRVNTVAANRCYNCGCRIHSNRMSCKDGCDPRLLTHKRLKRVREWLLGLVAAMILGGASVQVLLMGGVL